MAKPRASDVVTKSVEFVLTHEQADAIEYVREEIYRRIGFRPRRYEFYTGCFLRGFRELVRNLGIEVDPGWDVPEREPPKGPGTRKRRKSGDTIDS